MKDVRYRLFRKGIYVKTGYIDDSEGVAAALDALDTQLGDIVYIHDFFQEHVIGGWNCLGADDPKVQGLYSQAVRAERTAAKMN